MLYQRAQTHLEEGDPKMSECWTGGPADAYLCVVKKPEPEGACGGMDAYLSPLVMHLTQSNQTATRTRLSVSRYSATLAKLSLLPVTQLSYAIKCQQIVVFSQKARKGY